ncbi:MAG TPA: metalloregulator ArsR/SmtB family transcription factor [Anaerolineales bacterium]
MPDSDTGIQIKKHEAEICFALADPTRINIVHALEKHPHNVNELTLALGIPQPRASRHLKILRERGLVHSTRRGVCVTYTLSDPRLIEALALLNEISNRSIPLQTLPLEA